MGAHKAQIEKSVVEGIDGRLTYTHGKEMSAIVTAFLQETDF